MKYLSYLALVMALPAVAQASCPVAADLDRGGIVFSFDGDFEIHTRASGGVIEILSSKDADGIAVKTVLAHGVHVLQLADIQNGTVLPDSVWRFTFPVPAAELPMPVQGSGWTARTTSSVDGVSETEVVTHTWGTMQPYEIGRCTYEAIPVRVSFDGESYDHEEDLMYFPDLGTAVLIRYSDSEGADLTTYTDIRAK